MIVQLIPRSGVGTPPIVLDATQIIVRLDDGTPICAASHYGPDGSYAVARVGDTDFQQMLRALGVNMTVVVDTIQMPKPIPGSQILMRQG